MALSANALGATFILGGPGNIEGGDCAPFGCVMRYQQAYAASLFTGPITITGLTIFNTQYVPEEIDAATYTITLSTSLNPVGSLSATFAENTGLDAALFFNGALSGPASPSFTINGTAFQYNPAAGDLLIEVVKSGTSEAFALYTDFRDDFSGFQRVYAYGNDAAGFVEQNYGLVTGFTIADAPEPSTFGMAGAALAGLIALRRRRGK